MKQNMLGSSPKKLVIVSSSKEEAITEWYLSRQKKEACLLSLMHREGQIVLVLLSDVLKNAEIQDVLTQQDVCIQWMINDLNLTNKTHCLLNRVTYIGNELFETYCSKDKEYAKREFEAYLGFALNSFDKVQSVALNGLCERIYSLPQQWTLVRNKLNLDVPLYYWGFSQGKNNSIVPLESRVDSTIYDYLNWATLPTHKVELTPSDSEKKIYQSEKSQKTIGVAQPREFNKNMKCHRANSAEFYFQKPQGTPVFVLSIGQQSLLSTNLRLNQRQTEALQHLTNQVRRLFKYFIFELLTFLEDDRFVFGCVNIEIIHSRKNPDFFSFLDKHLIDEFYQCLS